MRYKKTETGFQISLKKSFFVFASMFIFEISLFAADNNSLVEYSEEKRDFRRPTQSVVDRFNKYLHIQSNLDAILSFSFSHIIKPALGVFHERDEKCNSVFIIYSESIMNGSEIFIVKDFESIKLLEQADDILRLRFASYYISFENLNNDNSYIFPDEAAFSSEKLKKLLKKIHNNKERVSDKIVNYVNFLKKLNNDFLSHRVPGPIDREAVSMRTLAIKGLEEILQKDRDLKLIKNLGECVPAIQLDQLALRHAENDNSITARFNDLMKWEIIYTFQLNLKKLSASFDKPGLITEFQECLPEVFSSDLHANDIFHEFRDSENIISESSSENSSEDSNQADDQPLALEESYEGDDYESLAGVITDKFKVMTIEAPTIEEPIDNANQQIPVRRDPASGHVYATGIPQIQW